MLELGIQKENITILNCYEKDTSNFKNIINNADLLVLPGGNPEMFFSKVVQETEILYEIKHFKGIIIGESAGACLQFKRYFITARNNYYKYFAWYDGFGVLNDPFYIDVHTINNRLYLNSLEKIANFNCHPKKYEFLDNRLAGIYEEILSKLDIKIIHINHLINHTFDLAEIANKKRIPYIVSIHDFYYICPSIHLINENYSYCEFKCKTCKFETILKDWQKYGLKLLENAYLNIVPSDSVIEIYKSVYPDLNNFKLIKHGRDIEKSNIEPELSKNPIKIAIPGHISQHKGSLLIKKIKNLDKDNALELHFMGTAIPNLNKYGINHGRYKRGDFNKVIAEINPSFIAILSTCPETFSHTLTESWKSGIPVIATNIGALKERVNKTGGGWLVDYKNPQKIYDKILSIDETDYLEKVENISKINF